MSELIKQLKQLIDEELRARDIKSPLVMISEDTTRVHIFQTVYGRSVDVIMRIRVPHRKRSNPEIIMLPNPYSASINQTAKEAMLAAMEKYRESL